MKKLILAAIASTLVASPIALAAPAAAQTRESTTVRQRPDGRTVVTQRTVTRTPGRNWRAGDHFDRRQAQDYRVVNYRTYRFAAPRRGQQWVRSGRDAVLIDARGNVIRVQPRAFR